MPMQRDDRIHLEKGELPWLDSISGNITPGSMRPSTSAISASSPVVDDVLAIVDDSLPYVEDWTKPDRANLEQRMSLKADGLIRDILKSRL